MEIILWLVLAGLFLAVEFGTVALISIWFVVGSVAALISALLGAALWLQILVFALVSLVALLVAFPLVKKRVAAQKVPTNVDALPGRKALVTEAIDNLAGTGTIKLEGKLWTARSADG
ncbi:MAG: NfeD family protein, partial [Oscillospiraceae bacterium]|nr:NfeD family protein [Oscillospiraceae bacterium]